jgi:hypothetical protein
MLGGKKNLTNTNATQSLIESTPSANIYLKVRNNILSLGIDSNQYDETSVQESYFDIPYDSLVLQCYGWKRNLFLALIFVNCINQNDSFSIVFYYTIPISHY